MCVCEQYTFHHTICRTFNLSTYCIRERSVNVKSSKSVANVFYQQSRYLMYYRITFSLYLSRLPPPVSVSPVRYKFYVLSPFRSLSLFTFYRLYYLSASDITDFRLILLSKVVLYPYCFKDSPVSLSSDSFQVT